MSNETKTTTIHIRDGRREGMLCGAADDAAGAWNLNTALRMAERVDGIVCQDCAEIRVAEDEIADRNGAQ